nr:unnamed protein product [Digitaria exilis]
MDFGDDVMDGSDGQRRKKRYHRHTPRQIQQLEAMFKECPHPDENQRMQLSRELGLEPRQIKFWFQNRRTQMKAQHERQDNCFLRAENDKIRCENIAMREALRNVICPTCGGPPVADDYFDEQKLRMENARLKEEASSSPPLLRLPPPAAFSSSPLHSRFSHASHLDRVSSLTSKYLGRPITQLPPVQPLSMSSSLDLSVGGLCSPALGPSLDLVLLSGGSSCYHHPGAAAKWTEFFPSIVSKARTIDVLVNGMAGRSESLVLMYEELHVMSPVVPTREFCFLRYCRQIEHGLWAIADVSVDLQPRDARFGGAPPPRSACERCACLATAGMPSSSRDVAGVTPEGKRSMMKLSQRMVSSFSASLSASQVHRWMTLSGPNNDVGVRVMVQRSTDPGQPSGVVLSAATSIWLPVPCDRVFAFVRDENTRSQWDVLSHGNPVQEVSRVPNGSHPGNCISLLRGLNASQNSMLILQESCTDASGSLVVYAPIDLPAANVVMSGEDPSAIPLLPSGFTILPDGRPGSSSSGSLVTVAFQILVSSLPSSKLNAESVATVNSLISTTVEQIKAALNCASH